MAAAAADGTTKESTAAIEHTRIGPEGSGAESPHAISQTRQATSGYMERHSIQTSVVPDIAWVHMSLDSGQDAPVGHQAGECQSDHTRLQCQDGPREQTRCS